MMEPAAATAKAMSTRRLLAIFLTGLPAAFAAGWYLKPASSALPDADGKGAARRIAGAPGSVTSRDTTSVMTQAPTAPEGIQPLASLDDILTTLNAGGSTKVDEMTGLSMLELAPRLVITSLPVIRSILLELENSASPQGDLRQAVALGLMMRWLVEQPDAALSYSFENPKLLPGSRELKEMGLAFLAKKNPQAAQSILSRLPPEQQADLQKVLDLMQALKNPAQTLADPQLSAQLPESQKIEMAARWMESDPTAAFAWLQALPPDQRDPELVGNMAVARMKTDPVSTLAWISSLPEGDEKRTSRSLLISNTLTGVRDPGGLEAVLAQYPTGWQDHIRLRWMKQNDSRGDQAASQLKSILERNPALASDQPALDTASSIAQGFAGQADFAGGSQWALSLPPGPTQESAAAVIIANWAETDPTAASLWLNQLPTGPTRDSAAASLIRQIQAEDPASALVWAQSLSTPQQQKKQSQQVFKTWFERQPLEAAAAIQNLPPEAQQRLFSK